MAEGKLYFAYGSNINLDQMAQRCPDAQVVGPVTLENYELLFHGNLRGAGVATIAPREGSTVHGLLWNITPECERSLDYYEGYPHLYGKEPVTVHGHDGQEHTVMAYVMTELCKEPSIPSFYYYNGILEATGRTDCPQHRSSRRGSTVWRRFTGRQSGSTAAPAASSRPDGRKTAGDKPQISQEAEPMPNKSISLSGEVHISTEQVYTTVDALEALKAIGLAYGLYSRAEELRGQRVHLTGGEGHTALVVQEDFSCHGSPCWETVRTLTEDPAEIQQYMAFRDVLRIVQQRDREERLPAKQRTGDSFPEHPPRQGGRSRER